METEREVYFYQDEKLVAGKKVVVEEFLLKIIVNEREIATLMASPHDLRFLVAGFLRVNGFVDSVNDFEMFSVCDNFGVANVKIKKALPDKLLPILTTGCGSGVSFSMGVRKPDGEKFDFSSGQITPLDLFSMMKELSSRAENYRKHGGIHSAGAGEKGRLILYSEDLGRHNTIDRIAGEALFKGVDLTGKTLITSGRVSSEMLAKSAILKVGVVASRTAPTTLAVKIAEEYGITLIGYVRGGKFTVYTHPQRLICECR